MIRTQYAIWDRVRYFLTPDGYYLLDWVTTSWDRGRAKIKRHTAKLHKSEIVSLRPYIN